MDITNVSSESYVFVGGRALAPNAMIHFDNSEYGDDRLRHEINALYSSGKITVSNAPTGFPIEDSTSGNGGSLPEQWIVGDDGSLEIDASDPTGNDILKIQAPEGYHQTLGDGWVLRAIAGDGTDIITLDPSANLVLTPSPLEGTTAKIDLHDSEAGDDPTSIAAGGENSNGTRLSIATAGRRVFVVDDNGVTYIAANAAPADNELQAGEMALWFDSTNGAAKLKIKGKSADGTVITGEMAQPIAYNHAGFGGLQVADGTTITWGENVQRDPAAHIDGDDPTKLVFDQEGWFAVTLLVRLTGSPTPDISLYLGLNSDEPNAWEGQSIEISTFTMLTTLVTFAGVGDSLQITPDNDASITAHVEIGIARTS